MVWIARDAEMATRGKEVVITSWSLYPRNDQSYLHVSKLKKTRKSTSLARIFIDILECMAYNYKSSTTQEKSHATWARWSIDQFDTNTFFWKMIRYQYSRARHQALIKFHPLWTFAPCHASLLFLFAIKPYHPFLALVKITTAWSICREHRMIDVVIRSWKIKYVVYYFLCQELINPLYFRTERGRSVSFGHGYLEHLSRITRLSNSDFE